VPARILLFSLDDLRRRYGHLVPPGADPRADTAPFRAFRAGLLEAARQGASEPCDLSFWWEGTFNGYALAVGVRPPEALARLDLAAVCPLEDERVAPPPPDRWALAVVVPGHVELARGEDGSLDEAPFGAATGHFGAPGVRRVS
jgi:hypothetical protein